MGCNCGKKERNFLVPIKEARNTERIEQIIHKNFGGSKNPVDRKRKIAILKRKQKL